MSRKNPKLSIALTLYHGRLFPMAKTLTALQGLTLRAIQAPLEIETGQAILLLDDDLLRVAPLEVWREHLNENSLIIGEEGKANADLIVPPGWPSVFLGKALESAIAEMSLRESRRLLREELHSENKRLAQLTSIAQDLSAETNLDKLLTKILTEGRLLACCDAASLFLVERNELGQDELVFKLTQNDSISFPFEEKRFPLSLNSISGFVAIRGEICNIPDVYEIEESAPYTFNRSIDQKMGYRTRSTLTIPMRDHQKGKGVIGVLQFLNRKTSPDIKLNDVETTLRETLPFSEALADLLMALASQAAVAIENARLIAQVYELFEGFVKASVTAIEQRDPTTSGHSFRVANLTTALAEIAPRSGIDRFKDVHFDEMALREIRYASLLHDFGKVGVREHVLTKANKLSTENLEIIRLRFALMKEQVRHKTTQQLLDFVLRHGTQDYDAVSREYGHQLAQELERFELFFENIDKANKPHVLDGGCSDHLHQIKDLPPIQVDGSPLLLLTENEFLALSVRRGSLTESERTEIESHVRHTFDFLSRIPWTDDLKRAPEIAFAHHEKLNGKGYPRSLKGDEIPLPSRMMTVADIYDALTASDRPYKSAMPRERAFDILHQEVAGGALDLDLVNIFIEAKVYERAESRFESFHTYQGFTDRFVKRGPCDYDLPTNPWDTNG